LTLLTKVLNLLPTSPIQKLWSMESLRSEWIPWVSVYLFTSYFVLLLLTTD
jgi:hypothetical protein